MNFRIPTTRKEISALNRLQVILNGALRDSLNITRLYKSGNKILDSHNGSILNLFIEMRESIRSRIIKRRPNNLKGLISDTMEIGSLKIIKEGK